jgi:hypothetical protein
VVAHQLARLVYPRKSARRRRKRYALESLSFRNARTNYVLMSAAYMAVAPAERSGNVPAWSAPGHSGTLPVQAAGRCLAAATSGPDYRNRARRTPGGTCSGCGPSGRMPAKKYQAGSNPGPSRGTTNRPPHNVPANLSPPWPSRLNRSHHQLASRRLVASANSATVAPPLGARQRVGLPGYRLAARGGLPPGRRSAPVDITKIFTGS